MSTLSSILNRIPGVKSRLKGIMNDSLPDLDHLTQRAGLIYDELKSSVAAHQIKRK